MTLTPGFTPSSRAELMSSVSSLALASAEVQQFTTNISSQVKAILEAPQAANDNKAPETEVEQLAA